MLESVDYFLSLYKIMVTMLKYKRFNDRKCYLSKGIIDNYNVIISGKNFYDQGIDLGIKRYEVIRKLTTGQGEVYTTGCLLDYEYTKNYYRLIAVILSRQKELDTNPKAIQQIEFVGQLKTINANDIVADAGNDQSIFFLIILEKIKEGRLKFFQGIVIVL